MNKVCKRPVMLVDDNEIDLFINERLIQYSDFASEIICYLSGKKALEYLQSAKELPQLIFLDLNMPVIDGFKFLYELSQLPQTIQKEVKVVVLASSANDRDKEKAEINPNVIKYFSKPLNEEKLDSLREEINQAIINN